MMEKAFEFLRDHKEVALATVEDEKPKIRVFKIMKQEGRTLYFAAGPHKAVCRQLRKNPNVELLAMCGNVSVRIAGRAVFDVADDVAQEIFDSNPVLPRLYGKWTDLVYFRLPIAALDYYDLTPDPPLQEHAEWEA